MVAMRAIIGRGNVTLKLRSAATSTKAFVGGGSLPMLGVGGRSIHLRRGSTDHHVAQSLSRDTSVHGSHITMPSMMSRGPSSQGRLMHSTRSALVSLTNGAASNGDDNKSNTNGGGGGHAPAEISIEEYHERADAFMNELVAKLEDMQDRKDDMDVEYTAGVLNLTFLPAGSYVINKQPPNKQIWLSSPVSGPKRYDWVLLSESMHDKEGTGAGDWVYLRDMSTLADLLRKELGVNLGLEDGTV